MLRGKELFHILQMLKENKCVSLDFSGVCIVLLEDSTHLILVPVEVFWDKYSPSLNIDDWKIWYIYNTFHDVLLLKYNNQVNGIVYDIVHFNNLLELVMKGKMREA